MRRLAQTLSRAEGPMGSPLHRIGESDLRALALAHERGKPVVIQKVGRSNVGAEAAASHTASLTGAKCGSMPRR